MHDGLPNEPYTLDHPIDRIDPEVTREDALREGALNLLRGLNAGLAHILTALHRNNPDPWDKLKECETAFWQVAYPLGASCCDDVTMSKRAEMIGIRHATISKFATAFCRAQNIPPSAHMKAEGSAAAYRDARVESVRRSSETLCPRAAHGSRVLPDVHRSQVIQGAEKS